MNALKHYFTVISCILIVLLTIGYAFEQGYLRFNYHSSKEFPIRGIDVSHHQGEIDWPKVKTQGIDFAYIKATEGGDFKDPDFQQNWTKASEATIFGSGIFLGNPS